MEHRLLDRLVCEEVDLHLIVAAHPHRLSQGEELVAAAHDPEVSLGDAVIAGDVAKRQLQR